MLAGLGGASWWALQGVPRVQAAGPGLQRELRILSGPDSAAGRQITQALKLRYPSLVAEVEPGASEGRRGPAIHVAVGPAALRRALQAELKGPLVSVMTSSQTYRQLVDTAAVARDRAAVVTAIHADASPAAQMQLIAALFEARVTVGVLLSEASAYLERPLRQAATQFGLELVLEWVAPSTDAVRSLTRLRAAQVLLAVADSTLYTPDTLRAILESTYRRSLPVVGFSSATVVAGTLATAHCAVDDVVADLVDLLEGPGLHGSGPWPEPRFAQHWRVAINDNVARSLGITVTDKVRALGHQAPGRAG